jgi:hypothetical protein
MGEVEPNHAEAGRVPLLDICAPEFPSAPTSWGQWELPIL